MGHTEGAAEPEWIEKCRNAGQGVCKEGRGERGVGGAGPDQVSPDLRSKETGFSTAGNGKPPRAVKTAVGGLDWAISLTDAHHPGDSVIITDHGSCMSSFALLAYPVRSEILLHFIKFRKMF